MFLDNQSAFLHHIDILHLRSSGREREDLDCPPRCPGQIQTVSQPLRVQLHSDRVREKCTHVGRGLELNRHCRRLVGQQFRKSPTCI